MEYNRYTAAIETIRSCAEIFEIAPELLCEPFDIIFDSISLREGPERAGDYADEVINRLVLFEHFLTTDQWPIRTRCASFFAAAGTVSLCPNVENAASYLAILKRQYFRVLIARGWAAADVYLHDVVTVFRAEGVFPGPLPGMIPSIDKSAIIDAKAGA